MRSVGDQWKKTLEEQSDAYSMPFDRSFMERFLRSPYLRVLSEYFPFGPGKYALEAGCGSGKFSLGFARLGCTAVALDFSVHVAVNVRRAIREAETAWGAVNLTTTCGDIEHLPFPDATFDLAFNEGVVEHWLDDLKRRKVLQEMVRVTKPGGVVCIIVPNGQHPLLPFWMRYMPAYQITPPMTLYTCRRMESDLKAVGLSQIATDGIYAWHSISFYPALRLLRWIGGALERLVPLPHSIRERWGVNLIAQGRKT